jgi:drug/metabolite transporter (DMT)-like permease
MMSHGKSDGAFEARDNSGDEQVEGHDPLRVRAALISVQLLFGVHYLVAKWIVSEMEPAAWACLRVCSSFAVLALLALLGRRSFPPLRDTLYLGFCSLFGVILNQALFLEGIKRTTPGHAALINSQIPTFALLAAVLFKQESLSARKTLSFLAGIAGVLVLLEADQLNLSSEYLHGDLLNLANACSYGLFIVLSRRVMARHDPLAATTVIFLFGSLGMLLYGADDLWATDLGNLSDRAVGGMVFAVLGATVLTYFLNYWTLKRTHASHVALYIFLQPVVAAALGIWLMGDAITPRFLVATLFVFMALFLRDNKRHRL